MFNFGNHYYFLFLIILIGILLGFYFLLRNKSIKVQKTIIFLLMLLNLFQHIFKCIVWPHLYGTGFNAYNTAYNFCALMIILSPIIFITRLEKIKALLCVMGTISGVIAVLVPYWFFGTNIFVYPTSSEYARFYICHLLLFLSSFLPVLLKLQKFSWRSFYFNGFIVLLFLGLILINNFTVASITNKSFEAGINAVLNETAVYIGGPRYGIGFDWLMNALVALCPPFFKINYGTGYLPILWYAIPVYVLFTLISFVVYIILDKNSFIYKNKKGE